MNLKYELIKDDTCEATKKNGVKVTLYRIKSLRSFGDVIKGDLGGYVESERNLSHEGDCWVYDNSEVYGDAVVYDDAKVSDYSYVYDESKIFGEAIVKRSFITDKSEIFDRVILHKVRTEGNTKVYGRCEVENFELLECIVENTRNRLGEFGNHWTLRLINNLTPRLRLPLYFCNINNSEDIEIFTSKMEDLWVVFSRKCTIKDRCNSFLMTLYYPSLDGENNGRSGFNPIIYDPIQWLKDHETYEHIDKPIHEFIKACVGIMEYKWLTSKKKDE